MLYPTQVSGDPDHVYPVEVMAHTSCGGTIPTVEVQNLVLDKLGSQVGLGWHAAEDSCLAGYDVLGSDTPDSAAGYSVIGTTDGATTYWFGNPTQSFFIVIARGAAGGGPWGHYGQ
jgi:hypothetical protein